LGLRQLKSKERIVAIDEEIKTHNERVMSGDVECRIEQCLNLECSATGSDNFRLHERRPRTALALIELLVIRFDTFVLRWKCEICKKTCTEIPDFLLPGQRYVKPTILKLGQGYVVDERATYRSVVRWLGYGSEDGPIDERRPSHSRVWYWLNMLGQMEGGLRRAKRLIRAKDPSSPAVGRLRRICPRKYRSEKRREILQTAWSVLRVEADFVRLFGFSIFPKFGTGLA
jgi:hypothetical protein